MTQPVWRLSLLPVVACMGSACADQAPLDRSADPSRSPCACPLDAELSNLALCVSPSTAFAPAHVFSSHRTDGGAVACEPWRAPQPLPAQPWSSARISSPCAGAGMLCVRVRSGDVRAAQPSDCTLTERCVSFDYPVPNLIREVAPVGAWVAESDACAQRYEQQGGYIEFRVDSAQLGCGEGAERITRVAVCPTRCQADARMPGCEACGGPEVTTRF
jgi:hypothetical protein